MFDNVADDDVREGEDDLVWAGLLHSGMQLTDDADDGRDDLSERLRRSGGLLPGSDPRR